MPQRNQARKGKGVNRLLALQRLQPCSGALTKKLEVAPQGFGAAGGETAEALAQQHGGPSGIPTLQMEMGDGDLQDSLKDGAQGSLGFMPELLKAIVAGMPFARIEQFDRLVQPGILQQACLLGEAFSGN